MRLFSINILLIFNLIWKQLMNTVVVPLIKCIINTKYIQLSKIYL